MVYSQKLTLRLFLLLLSVSLGTVLCDCDALNKLYVIKYATVNFALDVTNPKSIKLQIYDPKAPSQQFRIECGSRAGLLYLVHNATGEVLESVGTASTNSIALAPKDATWKQQWILNAHNVIQNAGILKVLHVGAVAAGSTIILDFEVGIRNQLWTLVAV